ncbi:hypothetical protein COV82_00690 [Candidatus Peregrinibacteria bacterium CG11_big_fil_rev_8_21_14_0_20_46_8]|nr:MAG: hypothetical protein COV82_00690 [Candidatus Peregrinibacteria bacterium CG11_big_fil_rev_8_21_14_0_20_46_8]
MVNSRHIISEAWAFTRQNKRLMWWYAFLPALFTTLISIIYLIYQYFAFKYSALFDDAEQSFLAELAGNIYDFLSVHRGLIVPAILVTALILIIYALLPTLCQGGLIQLIARAREGKEIRVSDGVGLGLVVFLPLFEYNLLIRGFSLFAILTEAAFVLRNLGPGALETLLPFFVLAGLIGFLLTLLFTYSEFFIVLKRSSVLSAMAKSAKLVLLSWQHTFIIGVLMLLIGVRIIINIVAVLIVPTVLFITIGLFAATAIATQIAIVIGILLSIVGLIFASYFTGILNLFSNAVWTFTFLALIENEKAKEFIN